MLCVHCAKRCHDGHRGIKYLRTSKVACMCFECCDCILMKEVEQKAREEGIVPLNKLARYEAEEVRRRVNLGKDVPAVLALLPERPEKERKKGYFGAQVEGWCLARRAEFTDPVDGWQILVDPQQRARGVPQERWTWLVSFSSLSCFGPLRGRRWRVTRRWRLHETSSS